MDELLDELLKSAGLESRGDNNNKNNKSLSVSILESWLELSDDNDGPSIEDSEPTNEFYQCFSDVLVFGWRAPLRFLETEHDVDQLDCILVTKWLRHAMDLHVSSQGLSLTHQLLYGGRNINDNNNHNSEHQQRRDALLEALYFHVTHLAQLQSLLNSYNNHLLKNMGKIKSSSSSSSSRLEEYTRIQTVSDTLQRRMEQHCARLEFVLGEFYREGNANVRTQCRQYLGVLWHAFAMASRQATSGGGGNLCEDTRAAGMDMTLRLLRRIVRGFNHDSTAMSPPALPNHQSSSVHRHLLFYILIPLHAPNSLVLWRDQTALLSLYHEPLVQCMAILLRRNPQWIAPTVAALLANDIWQITNTPKILLLLHEIDTLLNLLLPTTTTTTTTADDDDNNNNAKTGLDRSTWLGLIKHLVVCMSSDNSRLAERALQFFRNQTFLSIFQKFQSESLPMVLRAIVHKGELPWNPTVRKMNYNVLKDLHDQDPPGFERACETTFGQQWGPPSSNKTTTTTAQEEEDNNSRDDEQRQPPRQRASKPPDFSLKAAMGNWQPPTSTIAHAATSGGVATATTTTGKHTMHPPPPRPPRLRGQKNPPLAVTGVAPWARGSSKSTPPPLTITGVAPWASNNNNNNKPQKKKPPPVSTPMSLRPLQEESDHNQTCGVGLKFVLDYMEKVKPPPVQEGASPWAKAQMSESPTLLPSLKFHDLVFGHELGKGAFGVVRYARQIDRTKTRSHWPEYAVKVISTPKIQELGYEKSVQREMAILRHLSHPGIARLISSFRFRDGAYLVLEYASDGDLHGLLRKKGSLDQASTRFVIGEIVAALWSIHEAGFVYGDLKPENVLITETGHIKITDFGGCRPYTEESKQLIRSSAKNQLKELRDGDWKSNGTPAKEEEIVVTDWSGKPASTQPMIDDDDDNEEEDDMRIEGTIAYLPPEVVLGSIPTTAADVWALGCVLYQCLTGRPPHLEDDDELTKDRIVSFDVLGSSAASPSLFEGDHAKEMGEDAKSLVRQLLSRRVGDRPALTQVTNHSFFGGSNVLTLHQRPAHSLDVGTVAPVADAKWARRQFSSIWAPQPKAYDISESSDDATNNRFRNNMKDSDAPIVEGEERLSFFSFSNRSATAKLSRLREDET